MGTSTEVKGRSPGTTATPLVRPQNSLCRGIWGMEDGWFQKGPRSAFLILLRECFSAVAQFVDETVIHA